VIPRIGILACAVSAVLLVSCATGPGTPIAREEDGPLTIQFTAGTIQPPTARIPADGNVTWTNLALEYAGTIVLPESMIASFTCGDDLRPTFSKIDAGYQSLPITQEDPENVTLPCPLRPGTYTYEIWLYGQGLGEVTGDDVPTRILRGTLVVE